jgi:hypothetical protein
MRIAYMSVLLGLGLTACGDDLAGSPVGTVVVDAAAAGDTAVIPPGDGPVVVTPDGPVAGADGRLAGPDAATVVDAHPVMLSDGCTPQSPAAATTGTYHKYVTSVMKYGSTRGEAMQNAFDIDGSGRKNEIGAAFATFASMGQAYDPNVAAAIASGNLVQLHQLRADDLTTDMTVSWQDYAGNYQNMPDFSGNGHFGVDLSSPLDAIANGSENRGNQTGGPGSLFIALPTGIGQNHPSTVIELVAAKFNLNCTAMGCTGSYGGGVTADDMQSKFYPAIAAGMTYQISQDGTCATTCPAGCNATDTQNLAIFDTNHDCKISGDELANSFIATLFRPDLDLFDANGNRCGGTTCVPCDGVNDSVSVGVSITTVGAVFGLPVGF